MKELMSLYFTLRCFFALLLTVVCFHSANAQMYRVTNLGTLGRDTYANDINARGQIVGYSAAGGNTSQAFLWDPVHGIQNLGLNGFNYSTAQAINDNGPIAGSIDYRAIAF